MVFFYFKLKEKKLIFYLNRLRGKLMKIIGLISIR